MNKSKALHERRLATFTQSFLLCNHYIFLYFNKFYLFCQQILARKGFQQIIADGFDIPGAMGNGA